MYRGKTFLHFNTLSSCVKLGTRAYRELTMLTMLTMQHIHGHVYQTSDYGLQDIGQIKHFDSKIEHKTSLSSLCCVNVK